MATARRTSTSDEELRIVLLGRLGTGKNKVARFLFGSKEPEGEVGLCILHEGEATGRRICLVETPGCDQHATCNTPEKIKNEIVRSMTLCAPGPHALILVLRVESLTELSSVTELKTASRHMELLSERVWKHTVVLFLCDEEVEDPTIEEHIQNASKLLDKCGNRHYVLRSEAQVLEFLQEIEKMVEGNCGDFFLPQIYYDYMQKKTPHNITELTKMYEDREEKLKQIHQKRLKQAVEETEQKEFVRKRRESLSKLPLNMKEADQKVNIEAVLLSLREDIVGLVKQNLRTLVVMVIMAVMIVIGALIGSVSGAVFGVLGACVGIVLGAATAVPLTLWFIDATRFAKDNAGNLQERKGDTKCQ